LAKASSITRDENALSAVDRLVSEHRFPNRGQAIQEALDERLTRLSHIRLAQECAKLDGLARGSGAGHRGAERDHGCLTGRRIP